MNNLNKESWKSDDKIKGNYALYSIIFDARDLTVKIRDYFDEDDIVVTFEFIDIIAYRITEEHFL